MRRQTAAKAGEKEFQVLDYQNTSADLLPLVASSYALIFMVRCPSTVVQHAGMIDWVQPRSGCEPNFSWQGASAGLMSGHIYGAGYRTLTGISSAGLQCSCWCQ